MASPPQFDPASLGNLALGAGKVSHEELQQAIHLQTRRPGALVGELLVEMGVLSHDELEWLLARQERVRAGAPNAADVMSLADYAVQCVERAANKLDGLGKGR